MVSFNNLDGPFGNDAIITSGGIQSNTINQVSIEIFNQQVNPTNFFHNRIANENDRYHLFYTSTLSLNIDFTYNYKDENEYPIDLQIIGNTGPVSKVSINVVLYHKLDKNAEGVTSGNPRNARGTRKISFSFILNVN